MEIQKIKIYGNLWLIDGHFLIKTSRSEVKVNFHFSHLIGFLTNPKREAQINIVFRLYRLIVNYSILRGKCSSTCSRKKVRSMCVYNCVVPMHLCPNIT